MPDHLLAFLAIALRGVRDPSSIAELEVELVRAPSLNTILITRVWVRRLVPTHLTPWEPT